MKQVTLETVMACLKQVTEAYSSLADTVAGLHTRMDVVSKQFNDRLASAEEDRKTSIAQLRNTVETRFEEMRSGLCTANEDNAAAVGASIEAMRVAAQAISRGTDEIRAALMAESKATSERFSEISESFNQLSGSVDTKIDAVSAIVKVNGDSLSSVIEHVGKVEQAVHENRSAVSEAAKLASEAADIAGEAGKAAGEIAAMNVRATASIDELGSSVESVRSEISVIADNLRAETNNRAAADEDKAVEFRTAVESRLSAVATVAESAAQEAQLALNSMAVAAKSADEKIDGIADGLTSEVKALLEGLINAVDAKIEALERAVEDTPPPPQFTEPTVVAPKLDICATDTGVEVRLLADDGSVAKAVEVPVSVGMRYAGTYDQSKTNKAGDLVTHNGSLWICNGGNTDAPGKDFTGWRLIVKRGSDGRSIRSYSKHEQGTLYYPGDMLKINGRLWQSEVKTSAPPEGAQIASNEVWSLISGVI